MSSSSCRARSTGSSAPPSSRARPFSTGRTAWRDLVSTVNLSGAAAGTTYTCSYAGGELTLTADDDVASTQTVVVDTDPGTQVINFDKLGISFTYTGDVDTAAFATQTIATE